MPRIRSSTTTRDGHKLQDDLGFEGYQTLAAASGQEGLDLAYREGPDLVLLDVAMPGLSGWDVLRTLRRKGSTSRW